MQKIRQSATAWALFIFLAIFSVYRINFEANRPIPVSINSFVAIKHVTIASTSSQVKSFVLSEVQVANRAQIVATFADVPEMVNILACESNFRQFTARGSVLMSSTSDAGIAQINLPTWGERARALGLDIYGSTTDNLKMARVILNEQGLEAWTCYRNMLK